MTYSVDMRDVVCYTFDAVPVLLEEDFAAAVNFTEQI